MAEQSLTGLPVRRLGRPILLAGGLFVLSAVLWPEETWAASVFMLRSLVLILPIVVPGIVLAAWIVASGADAHITRAFEGRVARAVFAASLIGALTPVCGVTVLPLMAGLLAVGVPLAPIMAFWLSSPVTDPAMLATTAATLGVSFAIGKTVAAFGLGLYGGGLTALFTHRNQAQSALRDNALVSGLNGSGTCRQQSFEPLIWNSPSRRRAFYRQAKSTVRLMLICLVPAFFAEYALNAMIEPGSLAAFVGEGNWWAIPAAVLVGAPAYIDGYAALPLTRSLVENGMSQGAALAFLVSGGVVSIWGAMAIAPVLKLKPFLLYLGLAVTGSLAAGYAFEWII
ncbi:MAG: permease [Roseibium sp.]|uniref:permease n=1 Tax=Roseibium sp. TaxID=1936156 RepID=UPI001B0A8428|nr:permease [Roseibium sp.]MBO6893388.1 permease [Roseibium sp.]MBO6932488.1 permease [Roseibium sp.]